MHKILSGLQHQLPLALYMGCLKLESHSVRPCHVTGLITQERYLKMRSLKSHFDLHAIAVVKFKKDIF